MTGLQQIAIDEIVKSAVNIEHDYHAPKYENAILKARTWNKENKEYINEWHRICRKNKKRKLSVNPKWKKCYGGA